MNWSELILRTGGLLSPQECEELCSWAARPGSGEALEIGHYTGLSTAVILTGLPLGRTLTSIDNHGWRWVPTDYFEANAQVTGRTLNPIYEDYRDALPLLDGPFSFVFYDASHSEDDCRWFWHLIEPKLTPDALLLFDDADWSSMGWLGKLARNAGFRSLTRRPFSRHAIPYRTGDKQVDLDLGKRHPDTYTLEIMQRPQ